MHIAIDVVLLAIVVYCGWRGYRNGIIRGICGLLAIVIALYGAPPATLFTHSEPP